MKAYIVRRLLLIPLTLLGIILVNFAVVQITPGGPVEQMLSRYSAMEGEVATSGAELYRGARGLQAEFIAELNAQYGFDQPVMVRFGRLLWSYLTFEFGDSYYRDQSVLSLMAEKLPVSISLGVWSTLIIYLISIPLGIRKAVRDGSLFDAWTSFVVVIANAIPGFLLAILLIVLFAGGDYWSWFPLRGLVSDHWHDLSWPLRIMDYFWHLVLPVTALVVGGFATLTMLTKNSFLDELSKQYVLTARAKGASEQRILYRHVFRNAMLVVIAGFPAALIGMFFTGALLIEVIFSLDGLGLLSFQSVVNRDYPVMFAALYLFALLGLLLNLFSDLSYHWIDPRIDFESRG